MTTNLKKLLDFHGLYIDGGGLYDYDDNPSFPFPENLAITQQENWLTNLIWNDSREKPIVDYLYDDRLLRDNWFEDDVLEKISSKQDIISPQVSVSQVDTDAQQDAPTDAVTDYNVMTTALGILTGAVNEANAKQNDIAAKYNDLAEKYNVMATRFNALLNKLGLMGLLVEE